MFSEFLRHGKGQFLVSLTGTGSVLDLHFCDVVRFIGDVCDFTSVPSSDSGVWVLWVGSIVGSLFLVSKSVVTTHVTGGCCQTTFETGGGIVLVVIGALVVVPE